MPQRNEIEPDAGAVYSEPMNTTRLRVGVYCESPRATTLRFYRCLQTWGFAFRPLWSDELRDLRPNDLDAVLLPGGWYGVDRVPPQNQTDRVQDADQRARGAALCRFVQEGGGVVGVCCGAYNLVWMGLLEAEISRMPGAGPHTLEVVNAHHPIVQGVVERAVGRRDRTWRPVPVVRINGPILFPKKRDTLVFSYDWEGRLGAVLAGACGKGRAVAISPHPERTVDDTETDESVPLPRSPLMPVVRLLRNALMWSAGRDCAEPDGPDRATLTARRRRTGSAQPSHKERS